MSLTHLTIPAIEKSPKSNFLSPHWQQTSGRHRLFLRTDGDRQSDEIVEREWFGPVVSVTPFQSPEEAIFRANGSDYGLASSVWTRNISQAMLVAKKLQCGCTWINSHFMPANEMPHGGMKQSGCGEDLSAYLLDDYTVEHHVMVKL